MAKRKKDELVPVDPTSLPKFNPDGTLKAPGVPTALPAPVTPPPTFRYTQPNVPVAPLAKPVMANVDENAIREATRKRMQTSIDAIDASYNNMLSQERIQGEDRSGQTRAITARSGTLGQDFGNAAQAKTTTLNKNQEQQLADQRDAKVASVMQGIEDRSQSLIESAKAEAAGNYDRESAEYQNLQESARADLTALASSGFDIDTMDEGRKAALFQQAGFTDPVMGALVYNSQKPKAAQIDWKTEKLADGKLLFYGVDPVTGEMKQEMLEYDLPPDFQFTIAPDGTPIIFNKNTGEAQVAGEQGQFAKYEQMPDEEVLSAVDAQRLGVPYGTTKGEAAAAGIIPQAPLSAEAQKLQGNVQSAHRAMDTILNELFGEGAASKSIDELSDVRSNVLGRAALPFKMAGTYTNAEREVKDILVRLRSGAAISEAEEKHYQKQLPSIYDNEQTIKNKLKILDEFFSDIVPARIQTQGQADSLFEEFESGGSPDPKAKAGKTPFLDTLGTITGLDGSAFWKPGLDVDLKKGDPVKAPANSKVLAVANNGGFGLQVKLQTADGKELWLSHLDGANVKPGQIVKAGQVIAKGGNSGKTYSTSGGDGSHLDITMPNGKGGYFTAREVKAYLDNQFV